MIPTQSEDALSDPLDGGQDTETPSSAADLTSNQFAGTTRSGISNTLSDWITKLYEIIIEGQPDLTTIEKGNWLSKFDGRQWLPRYDDDDEMRRSGRSSEQEISHVVRWSTFLAGSVGFTTNLGGLLTLAVALPSNIVGVLAIQLWLGARIAHLRGYNAHDLETKTMVLVCLLGGSAATAVEKAGVVISGKLTANALAKLPGRTLIQINKAVGFRLLTKAGTTGVVNISRYVPLVGGAVGGAFDALTTQAIAGAAKRILVEKRSLSAVSDAQSQRT